ncbi:MAG: hypothetical protein ACHQ53_00435 [Polyangiales bacterium]
MTEVLLHLQASDEVRGASKQVRIALAVQQTKGGPWNDRAGVTLPKKGALSFPLDIPVLPRDPEHPPVRFELVVEALDDGGQPLVQERAITSFAKQQTLRLEVYLARCGDQPLGTLCETRTDCHGTDCQTCVSDQCTGTMLSQNLPVIANEGGAGSAGGAGNTTSAGAAGRGGNTSEAGAGGAGAGASDSGAMGDGSSPSQVGGTGVDGSTDAGIDSGLDAGPLLAAIATSGTACAVVDTLRCAAHDSRQALICSGGQWAPNGACNSAQRCQTRLDSADVGTCQPIASDCSGKQPGDLACDGAARVTCGPDLLDYGGDACSSHASCDESSGSVICVCDPFFMDDGSGGCADVDECLSNHGGCDPLASCTNNVGALATCGGCPTAYVGTGDTRCTPSLTALALSSGTLSPALSPSVTSYAVSVGVGTQSIDFMPSVPAGAAADLSPGSEVTSGTWRTPALSLGDTVLTLTVSQSGQPSRVYTITVTRGLAQQAYVKASNTDAGDWFGRTAALSADGNTLAIGAVKESSATASNQADNSAASSGAVYVFTRSGTTWSQQAFLKASNAEAGDEFGDVVAISADGNTLAVSADAEDSAATGVNGNQADNSVIQAGAVYVFTRSGTSWSQQAYVKASNPESGDYFGLGLALSGDGNTLAAGAYMEDSAATGVGGNQADNSASSAGAVYVFTRAGTTWSPQAYVKASNTQATDYFGGSLTLSSDGNTLAASATGEDSAAAGVNGNQADNSASSSGAVYVFARSGTTWSQQAYVKASNTTAFDSFGGVSLSGDGDTLAVTASSEDSAATGIDGNQADESAAQSGAAYVFTRVGTTWSQQAYIKASNTSANDGFGSMVALSGNGSVLAVGAQGEDSAATGVNGNQADNSIVDSGAVYLFSRVGAAWSEEAYLKASNPGASDYFGTNLALSADGNTLAVCGVEEDSAAIGIGGNQADNSATDSGAVYVFR